LDSNGNPTSDYSSANVTIVITDEDDEIPTFNRYNLSFSRPNSRTCFSRPEFRVAVAEDVGKDTPLPDLNMEVSDRDVSNHAEFALTLENVENAEEGIFDVYPKSAVGR